MILTQTEGIVEVVADKKYGEVLGIHFIGEGASEMAGVGAFALQMEATLEDVARAAFPHPTLLSRSSPILSPAVGGYYDSAYAQAPLPVELGVAYGEIPPSCTVPVEAGRSQTIHIHSISFLRLLWGHRRDLIPGS